MTTQPLPIPRTSGATTTDAHTPPGRLIALSGLAFVPFFVVGWVTSVAKNPHYTASDQSWTNWAHDNQSKARISAFAMLLAAFIFLFFISTVRSALETAETSVRGSAQLARVAFAGALTGIVGTTMAFITIAAASSEGGRANPVVSRAVTVSSTGPFLVGAMGFAALLVAAGLLTLRTGVFSRWSGIVALIGAACWLVTFLTVLNNTGNGSVFGYAFFPGLVSLIVWTVATSIASYRVAATATP